MFLHMLLVETQRNGMRASMTFYFYMGCCRMQATLEASNGEGMIKTQHWAMRLMGKGQGWLHSGLSRVLSQVGLELLHLLKH